MKPVLLLVLTTGMLFFSTFHNLNAQEGLDAKLIKKQVNCQDISENSSFFIVDYFERGNIDSCYIILDYWSQKCGYTEPVSRANMLLALAMHYYTDALVSTDYIDRMLIFMNRAEQIQYLGLHPERQDFRYDDFVPLGGEFDQWTTRLAKSLMNEYEPGSSEYLLSLFYSGECDTAFQMLKEMPYLTTATGKLYDSIVRQTIKTPVLMYHLYSGIWIPTRNLSAMGVHPVIGMGMGAKSDRNSYDFILDFKFVNTHDYYIAKRSKTGVAEPTRHFFGGYIGFEYSRDMVQTKKNELFYTIGAAYDGFDMFEEDMNNETKTSGTGSYNFNMGGGYRFAVSDGSWISIQGRYNVVDYTISDKFFLSGHTVTVRLAYSYRYNEYRNDRLKRLRYHQ
ncbi:MAG: hypothetical protein IPH20_10665 [Bacteroidales bacterium]|nr:hypothetical protein [Bacteroidales bacterium]